MATATGFPSFNAGSNFHVFTASMAFSSKPKPRLLATWMSRGRSVRAYHQHQHAYSLIFGFAGFLRIFRLGVIKRPGRGNATTDPENSSTDAATVPGAHSGTFARSNTTARARTDAAARTRAVGWWPHHVRHGVAQVGHVIRRQVDLRRNDDRGIHGQLRVCPPPAKRSWTRSLLRHRSQA